MQVTGPIGVLDSGVGGLSILHKVHQLLPREELLYVADSAHAPYGCKSAAFIQARCTEIMGFFLQRQVKAVVLACNTATAAAVTLLRERYALPIIGMEPALKPAAGLSRSGVVGVLATAGTIDSDKFLNLKSRYTSEVEIISRACHGLVELIENPQLDEAALQGLLREYVLPMLDKGADALVLGCTHYSLITEQIARLAGPAVSIVDTGSAVAREVQRRLSLAGLENPGQTPGRVEFYSSGQVPVQQALLSRYWGAEVAVGSLAAQKKLVQIT